MIAARTAAALPRPDQPLSRREQNKITTRHSIAQAALDLMRQHGHHALTVELIADAAQVSRRTFFNYFASIDDALSEHIRVVLERAFEELDAVPANTPVIEATFIAFQALVSSKSLESVAYLCAADTQSPSLKGAALFYWQEYSGLIAQHIIAKRPEIDPFHITVFAQSTIGACYVAFEHWGHTLSGPPTSADLQQLERLLTTALELIKTGFTSLSVPTPEQSA